VYSKKLFLQWQDMDSRIPTTTSLVVAMEEEEEEVDKTSRAAMEEEEEEEEDKTSQAAMEEEEEDKTSRAAMEEEEEDKTSQAATEEEVVDKTSQAATEEEVDKTSQAATEEEVDKTSQAAMEEEDKTRRVAAMALGGVISLQQQDTQILRKLLAMGTPQARRVPLTTRRRSTITKRRLQAVLLERQLWALLVMRHMNISRTRVTKDSSRAGATNKQFGTPKKEEEQNKLLDQALLVNTEVQIFKTNIYYTSRDLMQINVVIGNANKSLLHLSRKLLC
jgi:hypothetical protein